MKKEEMRVSFRIKLDLYETLRTMAYKTRKSQKNLVEEALALFFKKKN